MKQIDTWLNSITMYRLVLYYLIFLLVAAFGLSLFHLLPYQPWSIVVSSLLLVATCWITNYTFAWAFDAPTNFESVYISALILALIITPVKTTGNLPLLVWAGIWAMASKYIIAYRKKHLLNPAAFAVALTALSSIGSATWWVGRLSMLPFVLVGLLIVRKIRRFDLVFYFFITALITMVSFGSTRHTPPLTTVQKAFIDSPLFFFSFIMVTEPLTAPPTTRLQSLYGALVGLFFAPQFHIGAFYATPELALLLGNGFAFAVSPKGRHILTLIDKKTIGATSYDFIFALPQPMTYAPGQYMEWTLPHSPADNRGYRRYFTLASSPTEKNLRIGVKCYNNSSTFKQALLRLDKGKTIVASQLAGDFVLPSNPAIKLVLIAGGIGITPYRSMIQYLLDTRQKRDIVLLYSASTAEELVYQEVFVAAARGTGLKTVYTLTDTARVPTNWSGHVGAISASLIQQEVDDWRERTYYISGPQGMVKTIEAVVADMGVPRRHIKTDYFPGFV